MCRSVGRGEELRREGKKFREWETRARRRVGGEKGCGETESREAKRFGERR